MKVQQFVRPGCRGRTIRSNTRYRVEILTQPPRFIDEVELANGEARMLTVSLAGDEP